MKKHNYIEAIILMGLPLAGKSTWIKENGYRDNKDYDIISADDLKELHPQYDPNNAQKIHEWSVEEAENRLHGAIARNRSIVMDGGGINNRYTVRIITALKNTGYYLKLVHVKTPFHVCLKRMEERERKVPTSALMDKSFREVKQFHRLKEMVDEVIVEDYYTYKHIFVDMDGVIASYRVLQSLEGKIDFVNSQTFLYLNPVMPVIHKLKNMPSQYTTYILSATPNSFSYKEKNEWLDSNFNIPEERRFFVNAARHKAEMLRDLAQYLKIEAKDMVMIDDTHCTLLDVRNYGMRDMHPSEFLAFNFEKKY